MTTGLFDEDMMMLMIMMNVRMIIMMNVLDDGIMFRMYREVVGSRHSLTIHQVQLAKARMPRNFQII